MEEYLIDTNTVSDYFSAFLPNAGMQFMDGVIDAIPNLSIISQIELLCWKTDHKIEDKVRGFISDSIILDISSDIISRCVHLRRHHKIKTPDAIICATALSWGYTLLTNNIKDF